MKILVIDDNPIHQQAARQKLASHDLTVVGSYDEGQALVATKRHGFDVVLCDLLMPASGQKLCKRGRQFAGEEMPVGIFLALLAAKNGAKYVGLLTDSDHHTHPASACIDAFNRSEGSPTPFKVGDAAVLITNNFEWAAGSEPKKWDGLLNYLIIFADLAESLQKCLSDRVEFTDEEIATMPYTPCDCRHTAARGHVCRHARGCTWVGIGNFPNDERFLADVHRNADGTLFYLRTARPPG